MTDNQLKKISCVPDCGFSVQSHDEKEVIEFTKKHVKESHGKDLTDEEVREMITTV